MIGHFLMALANFCVGAMNAVGAMRSDNALPIRLMCAVVASAMLTMGITNCVLLGLAIRESEKAKKDAQPKGQGQGG